MQQRTRSAFRNPVVRFLAGLLLVLWHSAYGILIMIFGVFLGAVPRLLSQNDPSTDAIYLYSTLGGAIILYGANWVRRNGWRVGSDLKDALERKAFRQEIASTRQEITSLREEIFALRQLISTEAVKP